MKILFLDDSIVRTKIFLSNLIGLHGNIHTAKDSDECLKFLETNSYDMIFLDYDLYDSNDNLLDSTPVMEYLIANYDMHKHSTIIVHSLNETGSTKLFDNLTEAGYECYKKPNVWYFVTNKDNKLAIKDYRNPMY